MSLEIIPSGAALGAEIRGVDLTQPLDDATFAAIERAYAAHGVVFFRNQRITPPHQVAFTRRFGEIEFNVFGEFASTAAAWEALPRSLREWIDGRRVTFDFLPLRRLMHRTTMGGVPPR